MPIYEYKCQKCAGEFELFRNISDKENPRCKFCNGPVQKLISRSSFHLKGSGWYVTDYGGKKSGGQEEKKESSSDSTAKKEDSGPKENSKASSD